MLCQTETEVAWSGVVRATLKGTVGVFVVPKKLEKQRLIFDTQRVNQHFRRPWHCALPAPASWAELQLPVGSTYQMAQTDVNNAFHRILAPPGMSEYFIFPSVSTQLLLREGVDVPDHLLNLSGVSPQLQVLAWALYFCQKMVESCVRLAGYSADVLLMDRHRAPALTRDSICFGVYFGGVCAVGCNHSKVPAALEAMKVTLDTAGLQCSEVEAGTSKKVFTGLQLDHKTAVLSLEASRIWRLRHGLEFAARQRHLTGDQVAKLIEHITGICLLRRPALSLINVGYRFTRTFGPRSGRVWPAIAQEFRCIASLLPLLTFNLASPWSPWVHATDVSGGARGGYGVTRRKCDSKTVAAAGSCAERWR